MRPDSALAEVQERYPAWTMWRCEHTGMVWAAPPPGHPHGPLAGADGPEGIGAKLAEIESETGSWRAGMP